MTLINLNAWLEKQDIECPPHLVPKRIIDRRGIETHRCVTPIYSDDEVYSEDMHESWGAGSKKLFTAEFEAPHGVKAKYNEQDVWKDVFSMTMEMLENSSLDEEDKENAFGSIRRDFPIDETLDAANMQKIYSSQDLTDILLISFYLINMLLLNDACHLLNNFYPLLWDNEDQLYLFFLFP